MSSFFFLSPLVRLCHTFAEQTCLNSLYPIQSSSKILGDFLKIAYSRINSVMCSSVHFDNYIELPQYHTKLFFLKLPVQPLGTQSTTTLNPWEQASLCHPYNSTFSRISYTWNHIISEISLEVWFLSLSKMHLRSIHVDTWINVCSIFFFFFRNWSIRWIHHGLLIHSPGYLSCFQVWALMNKGTRNACVQVFVLT